MCEFVDLIKTSIDQFGLSEELNTLLDKYFDPFLVKASFLPSTLTDIVKTTIATAAKEKVNEVKGRIVNELDGLVGTCSARRLGAIEINEDGTQRLLSNEFTFDALANTIKNFDGVESAVAGYFAGRNEIALDVGEYPLFNIELFVLFHDTCNNTDFSLPYSTGIHLEVSFATDEFEEAISKVFELLSPAQAMFGANGSADVATLLGNAQSVAVFNLAISTGFKIGDLAEFFSSPTATSSSIGSLFFSIIDLGITAEASASGMNFDLFSSPNIGVVDGSFLLSVGSRLAAPFEVELNALGNPINVADFSTLLTGRLDLVPHGQLSASLPFSAEIGSSTQELTVILEDSDLFNGEQVSVRVDFDACQVAPFIDGLLAKMGSFSVSGESLLGNVGFSGIDFGGIDEYLPDVGEFTGGALEAKNEFFHICQEVEETGERGPTLEDVKALILEGVLGENSNSGGSSTTSRRQRALHQTRSRRATASSLARLQPRGHRALRATHPSAKRRRRALRSHHLPFNHYTRPRPSAQNHRHLQGSLVGDLLDSLSVSGGYDGSQFFLKLDIDISKQYASDLDSIIERPLELLREISFVNDLFEGDLSSISFDADISFIAGTHVGVTVVRVKVKHDCSYLVFSTI